MGSWAPGSYNGESLTACMCLGDSGPSTVGVLGQVAACPPCYIRRITIQGKWNSSQWKGKEGEMMFNGGDMEKMVAPALKTYVVWHNVWNAIALAAVLGLTGLLIYFFRFLHVTLGL